MRPEEVRHLLGGYASGTLSEAEKKALFEAAMHDQVLFDAMADEQSLKDLLDDPESRGYLKAALDEAPMGGDQPLLAPVRPRAAPVAPLPPAPASQVVPPRVWRPALSWGVVAAAALATVSVVGILRVNQKQSPAEVARNTQVIPTETKEPVPAIRVPERPHAKREYEAKAAGPAPKVPKPVLAEVDRRVEDKQQEAQKARDQVSQIQQPSAAPPPAPQQQERKEVSQGGAVSNSQVAQDQLQVMKSQLAGPVGARQLYLSPEISPNAQPVMVPGTSQSVEVSASPTVEMEPAKDLKKAKKAEPSGTVVARASGLAMGTASPHSGRAFAMRYRILRKSGLEFVQVSPGTRFRIGDEVLLVIEKNSGGMAAIDRIANGSTSAVPLAIQTNEMARSVPVTVNGPMELALMLKRTGALRGIPPRAASQKTEVADGMVYVAEPASSNGQALVVRVWIRVE